MITIAYGCTWLGDQCATRIEWRSEMTLSPETLFLVAMRQASDDGWTFNGNDPARALCPEHAPVKHGDLNSTTLRIFSRLHQVHGVHGLVMIGVEECLDGKLRVALGANSSPEATNLIRLSDKAFREVIGMMQEASHHVLVANAHAAAALEKA